jgi:hypothetical protein
METIPLRRTSDRSEMPSGEPAEGSSVDEFGSWYICIQRMSCNDIPPQKRRRKNENHKIQEKNVTKRRPKAFFRGDDRSTTSTFAIMPLAR